MNGKLKSVLIAVVIGYYNTKNIFLIIRENMYSGKTDITSFYSKYILSKN